MKTIDEILQDVIEVLERCEGINILVEWDRTKVINEIREYQESTAQN